MDFRLVDKSTVSPALMRFVGYCTALADGAEMPLASEFRMSDLHWLFGHVVIAEVIEGGRDYRYTHTGEFWKTMLNYDLTSQRLSDLEAIGRLTNFRSHYDAVVKGRGPRYRTARLTWPDGRIIRYQRLVEPFAGETGDPALLVIAAQSDKSFSELMEYKTLGEPKLELELSKQPAAA
jgi:hypothetical protein